MSEEKTINSRTEDEAIAEFLGWRKKSYPTHMGTPFHGQEVWFYHPAESKTGQFASIVGMEHFHDSWEWLMPVIEKIESMGNRVEIDGTAMRNRVQINSNAHSAEVSITRESKIEAAYEAVYQFIQNRTNE